MFELYTNQQGLSKLIDHQHRFDDIFNRGFRAELTELKNFYSIIPPILLFLGLHKLKLYHIYIYQFTLKVPGEPSSDGMALICFIYNIARQFSIAVIISRDNRLVSRRLVSRARQSKNS